MIHYEKHSKNTKETTIFYMNKSDQFISMINVLDKGWECGKYNRDTLEEIKTIIKQKIWEAIKKEGMNIYE